MHLYLARELFRGRRASAALVVACPILHERLCDLELLRSNEAPRGPAEAAVFVPSALDPRTADAEALRSGERLRCEARHRALDLLEHTSVTRIQRGSARRACGS